MTCTWATAGGNKLCAGGYTGTSVAPAVWSSCSWPSSRPNVRTSRLRTHAPPRRLRADNSSGREPAASRRRSTICAASSTAARPAPPRLLHPRYWVAQRWRGCRQQVRMGGPVLRALDAAAGRARACAYSARLCMVRVRAEPAERLELETQRERVVVVRAGRACEERVLEHA
jgi:hypothetical protein